MELQDQPPLPTWLSSEAKSDRRIDLVGLRYPAQLIGNKWMNAVTMATGQLRFISLRCWTIHLYWQARRPDQTAAWRDFAARAEAIFAMANLIDNSSVPGLVGSNKARRLLNTDAAEVPVERLVDILAHDIYAGGFGALMWHPEALADHRFSPGGVPRNSDRGLRLAKAITEQVQHSALGARLLAGELPQTVSREALSEFGAAFPLSDLSASEQLLFQEVLFPQGKVSSLDRTRLKSFTLWLELSRRAEKIPTDDEAMAMVGRDLPNLPAALELVRGGWARAACRELLAALHEGILDEFMAALGDRKNLVPEPVVMGRLVAAIRDRFDPKALGWGDCFKEGLETPFAQVKTAYHHLLDEGSVTQQQLRYPSTALVESELSSRALKDTADACWIAPMGWLLAAWRTRAAIESGETADLLSWGGSTRLGFADELFPLLKEFESDDLSYLDVIRRLIRWTLDQHVRVAWSRWAGSNKDIALVAREGDLWQRRAGFQANRTGLRVSQAYQWLQLIGCFEEGRLSAVGTRLLQQGLGQLQVEV